jgi:hypothetical protein
MTTEFKKGLFIGLGVLAAILIAGLLLRMIK